MDASSYGRMVEHGSAAETRYELRGEPGPEVAFPSRGDYIRPAAGAEGDPDDGTAGVPAKV